MSDRPPVDMPRKRPGSDHWTVSVSQVGTGFRVHPSRGLMAVGNWALNPYHRKGVANLAAQFWRMVSATYLRREYPKSEKALRKAISECEAWCQRERADEDAARAVLTRVAHWPVRNS